MSDIVCEPFVVENIKVVCIPVTRVKPSLHITRKDRKHVLAIMFFQLSRYGLVAIIVVMVASIDLSLAIVAVNILTALQSSLKHRRKHVLRLLRLYGEQALNDQASLLWPLLTRLSKKFILI